MPPLTRVLLVDNSLRARTGLRQLLTTWSEIEIVAEATNGRDAIRLVNETQPDIVVMDLEMPELDGIEATRLIKHRWPNVRVIILTMYATERAVALAAGADSFLVKGGAQEHLLSLLGIHSASA